MGKPEVVDAVIDDTDDTEGLVVAGAAKVYALTSHDLFHTPVEVMTPEERLGAGIILKALEDRLGKRLKAVKAAVQDDAAAFDDGSFSVPGVGKVKVVGGRSARSLIPEAVKALLVEQGLDPVLLDEDTFWRGGNEYKQVRMTGAPVLLAKLEGV